MAVNPSFTGSVPFLVDASVGGHQLLLAIQCEIGDPLYPVTALLDTAAEWSVLDADVARQLEVLDAGDLPMTMHTRFGMLEGQLVHLALRLPADEGESVTLDVRWFVCEHWPFPA